MCSILKWSTAVCVWAWLWVSETSRKRDIVSMSLPTSSESPCMCLSQPQQYLTWASGLCVNKTHSRVSSVCVCARACVLTLNKVEQYLFKHGSVDLWVCDGVEQSSLLRTGEDDASQLLPVYLPILHQHLLPKVLHHQSVNTAVWLHHCRAHTHFKGYDVIVSFLTNCALIHTGKPEHCFAIKVSF